MSPDEQIRAIRDWFALRTAISLATIAIGVILLIVVALTLSGCAAAPPDDQGWMLPGSDERVTP